MKEKIDYINEAYARAREKGLCHSRRGFAELLGMNEATLSRAFSGDEKYLTESFIKRIQDWENTEPTAPEEADTVLLLPWEAKGGLIGDFVDGIERYQCERIVSPIRGADYAMQVIGDSMSPEYPSGSVILIKKIDEAIFVEWGKVYVLDTPNGAVIKKVRKTEKPDVIECVSVNPDYQPFLLDCRHICGWYRVLMVMSAK